MTEPTIQDRLRSGGCYPENLGWMKEAAAALDALQAERDALRARVAELERCPAETHSVTSGGQSRLLKWRTEGYGLLCADTPEGCYTLHLEKRGIRSFWRCVFVGDASPDHREEWVAYPLGEAVDTTEAHYCWINKKPDFSNTRAALKGEIN